jgi:hypothetical protein
MSRTESTFVFSDTDTDPEFHTASATAHLLDELVLHGHRAGQDEPDPRPLPEPMPSAASSAPWSRPSPPC